MLMSTTSAVEQQPTRSAAIASAAGSRLSSEHIQPTALEWNVGVGSRTSEKPELSDLLGRTLHARPAMLR